MKPDTSHQRWYEVDRSQTVVFILFAIAALLGLWAVILAWTS